VKICHIITTIDAGGAEKHLLTLAKGQVELKNDVSVIVLKGMNELEETFSKSKINIIDVRKKSFVRQIIYFRKIVSDYDIVHAHLPRSELVTFFSSIHPKIKFFVTRHNAEPFLSGTPFIRCSSIVSKLISTNIRLVIPISETVQDFLFERREILPGRQSVVVRYGVEGNGQVVFQDTYKSDTTLKIICVARLEFQKDLPTLIQSIKILEQFRFNVSLDIFGSGSLEGELNKMIINLNLTSKIHLMGKTNDMDGVMKNYDILVLPSRYEGFGLVLLEAMKNGVPIIASNARAICEVLGPDYPGLFKIGDENVLAEMLVKFHDDRTYRAKLNTYLNERRERYSSKTMIDQTLQLYSSY
jgi:glycosyltransferase involved in cell wall biosynthesis